jgi:DNA-binding beta-propeller fold protein YncE
MKGGYTALIRSVLVACAIGLRPTSANAQFETRSLPLPGADGLVTLDYFGFDRARGRLWVPAGNTGRVDVIDAASDEITELRGFSTAEVKLGNRSGVVGPSSISIGDGVVYIGSRADASICPIDATTLRRGTCFHMSATPTLATSPDGLAYIGATKELWVTTGAPPIGVPPAEPVITILDAANPQHLTLSARLPVGGSAEGYAVDDQLGLFYTNLEEQGLTIAVDVHRRAIISRWRSGCDQPRGLALDKKRRVLFVACPDRVHALDAAQDGRLLDSLVTGDGLDNIDYAEELATLYAAASNAATLTIAEVDERGSLRPIAVVPTAKGVRGVVADGGGGAYVADPRGGRMLKVTPAGQP